MKAHAVLSNIIFDKEIVIIFVEWRNHCNLCAGSSVYREGLHWLVDRDDWSICYIDGSSDPLEREQVRVLEAVVEVVWHFELELIVHFHTVILGIVIFFGKKNEQHLLSHFLRRFSCGHANGGEVELCLFIEVVNVPVPALLV